eukprot:gnl/Chilomastix_cuspidata/1155.p1 GENE.gnl/Chilomastix_cuspidata/1155~~gnl/Chilomastix_cuspidata/1155.p1  ORF type:complete len:1950 (+),score=516.58 gnl/Chilomastix_cuspidata/1155:146-5995(+)
MSGITDQVNPQSDEINISISSLISMLMTLRLKLRTSLGIKNTYRHFFYQKNISFLLFLSPFVLFVVLVTLNTSFNRNIFIWNHIPLPVYVVACMVYLACIWTLLIVAARHRRLQPFFKLHHAETLSRRSAIQHFFRRLCCRRGWDKKNPFGYVYYTSIIMTYVFVFGTTMLMLHSLFNGNAKVVWTPPVCILFAASFLLNGEFSFMLLFLFFFVFLIVSAITNVWNTFLNVSLDLPFTTGAHGISFHSVYNADGELVGNFGHIFVHVSGVFLAMLLMMVTVIFVGFMVLGISNSGFNRYLWSLNGILTISTIDIESTLYRLMSPHWLKQWVKRLASKDDEEQEPSFTSVHTPAQPPVPSTDAPSSMTSHTARLRSEYSSHAAKKATPRFTACNEIIGSITELYDEFGAVSFLSLKVPDCDKSPRFSQLWVGSLDMIAMKLGVRKLKSIGTNYITVFFLPKELKRELLQKLYKRDCSSPHSVTIDQWLKIFNQPRSQYPLSPAEKKLQTGLIQITLFNLISIKLLEYIQKVIDSPDLQGLFLRSGIHIGKMTGGVIGTDKLIYDVFGTTINATARLTSAADPNTLFTSNWLWQVVKDYLFPFVNAAYQGPRKYKGLSEDLETVKLVPRSSREEQASEDLFGKKLEPIPKHDRMRASLKRDDTLSTSDSFHDGDEGRRLSYVSDFQVIYDRISKEGILERDVLKMMVLPSLVPMEKSGKIPFFFIKMLLKVMSLLQSPKTLQTSLEKSFMSGINVSANTSFTIRSKQAIRRNAYVANYQTVTSRRYSAASEMQLATSPEKSEAHSSLSDVFYAIRKKSPKRENSSTYEKSSRRGSVQVQMKLFSQFTHAAASHGSHTNTAVNHSPPIRSLSTLSQEQPFTSTEPPSTSKHLHSIKEESGSPPARPWEKDSLFTFTQNTNRARSLVTFSKKSSHMFSTSELTRSHSELRLKKPEPMTTLREMGSSCDKASDTSSDESLCVSPPMTPAGLSRDLSHAQTTEETSDIFSRTTEYTGSSRSDSTSLDVPTLRVTSSQRLSIEEVPALDLGRLDNTEDAPHIHAVPAPAPVGEAHPVEDPPASESPAPSRGMVSLSKVACIMNKIMMITNYVFYKGLNISAQDTYYFDVFELIGYGNYLLLLQEIMQALPCIAPPIGFAIISKSVNIPSIAITFATLTIDLFEILMGIRFRTHLITHARTFQYQETFQIKKGGVFPRNIIFLIYWSFFIPILRTLNVFLVVQNLSSVFVLLHSFMVGANGYCSSLLRLIRATMQMIILFKITLRYSYTTSPNNSFFPSIFLLFLLLLLLLFFDNLVTVHFFFVATCFLGILFLKGKMSVVTTNSLCILHKFVTEACVLLVHLLPERMFLIVFDSYFLALFTLFGFKWTSPLLEGNVTPFTSPFSNPHESFDFVKSEYRRTQGKEADTSTEVRRALFAQSSLSAVTRRNSTQLKQTVNVTPSQITDMSQRHSSDSRTPSFEAMSALVSLEALPSLSSVKLSSSAEKESPFFNPSSGSRVSCPNSPIKMFGFAVKDTVGTIHRRQTLNLTNFQKSLFLNQSSSKVKAPPLHSREMPRLDRLYVAPNFDSNEFSESSFSLSGETQTCSKNIGSILSRSMQPGADTPFEMQILQDAAATPPFQARSSLHISSPRSPLVRYSASSPKATRLSLVQNTDDTGEVLISEKVTSDALCIDVERNDSKECDLKAQTFFAPLDNFDYITLCLFSAFHFSPSVSVVHSDIVGFTSFCSARDSLEVIKVLRLLFEHYDAAAVRCGVEKIRTIGDAFEAVSGLIEENKNSAVPAVELAMELIQCTRKVSEIVGTQLLIRVGVSTGPVVGQVVGLERPTFDIFGETVERAEYLESLALQQSVHVDAATAKQLARTGRYHLTRFQSHDSLFITSHLEEPSLLPLMDMQQETIREGLLNNRFQNYSFLVYPLCPRAGAPEARPPMRGTPTGQ